MGEPSQECSGLLLPLSKDSKDKRCPTPGINKRYTHEIPQELKGKYVVEDVVCVACSSKASACRDQALDAGRVGLPEMLGEEVERSSHRAPDRVAGEIGARVEHSSLHVKIVPPVVVERRSHTGGGRTLKHSKERDERTDGQSRRRSRTDGCTWLVVLG